MLEVVSKEYKKARVKKDGVILTSDSDKSSCREVFLFDDFVIKFEALGSHYQNKRELYFYQEILEPEDEHFFPKLLAHGIFDNYSFIIQERVENTETPTIKHKKQLKYLTKKYELDDLIFYLPGEGFFTKGYVANIALTKEGLKIYDIGIHNNYIDGDEEDFSSFSDFSSYSDY